MSVLANDHSYFGDSLLKWRERKRVGREGKEGREGGRIVLDKENFKHRPFFTRLCVTDIFLCQPIHINTLTLNTAQATGDLSQPPTGRHFVFHVSS